MKVIVVIMIEETVQTPESPVKKQCAAVTAQLSAILNINY